MKFKTTITVFLFLVLSSTPLAADDSLADCKNTLKKFKELGNVAEMAKDAYGMAVMPTIGKGGLGIGGAGGSGCVFKGDQHTGSVKMGQVTIGWQAGGQAYSQLILLKNKDTYDEFTTGEFEFGAGASAVALTYGAQAEAGTKGASASAGDTKGEGMWKRGMAVFTLAKGGLMYEASIGGQKYSFKPL